MKEPVTNNKIVVVIPAYNESRIIAEVIKEIRIIIDCLIIVIDDGSHDETCKIAASKGVITVRHKINRGKGAATKTGIVAAHHLGAEVVVTMDGDGQHDPSDIIKLAEPVLDGKYDVVLGSRLINHEGMPFVKVLANKIGNFFTWLIFGVHVSDSQSGFRAYSNMAAGIIDTKADKYEYDSKVLREIINHRLKYMEMPIKVRYTEYSINKPQKQGFVNGLKTLVRMVWHVLT